MEKTKAKGFTGSDLKYIAILVMLIDHLAYLFIPSATPLYACMRFFGRLTAPIMLCVSLFPRGIITLGI